MNKAILSLKKFLRKKIDSLFYSEKYRTIKFGGINSWNVFADKVNSGSIIYSFGVGNDISFEKDLIKNYKCRINLYDPSPTGMVTMSLPENHNELIDYKAVGVAGVTGVVGFSPPNDPVEGSFRISDQNSKSISFECFELLDLMKSNNHYEIDLLKMDIEGFEYEVLESIFSSNINVKQICVEFHHFFNNISIFKTIKYIFKLYRNGYLLVYKNRFDYTFIKKIHFK